MYCRESVKNKAIYLFTSSPSPPAAKHRASERASERAFPLASPRLVSPAAKIAELLLAPVKRGGLQNVCCWNFSHTLKHKMDSSPFSTGEQKKKKKANKQTNRQTQQRGPTRKRRKKKKKRMMTNGSFESCIILPLLFACER